MLSPGLQAAVAGLQPRAHTSPLPPTPCSVHVGRPTRSTHRLVCRSHDDGKKSPKANKADFSAYWSFQVQQWFSSRRQYLEGDPSQKGKETAFDKKLDEQIEKSEAELKTIRAQERRELAEAISTQYASQLKAGVPVEQLPIPEVLAARDIVAGKAYLDSFRVKGLAIGLQRAERLLRSILMLPATVTVAAVKAWRAIFNAQRYEMFLMSEGERIWYWRNRVGNERWFWEVFAWNRLVFPILCTVAYEYLVPNHIIWAVVVPTLFIIFQTGSMLHPGNMEFWLIAYFGLYKKCWSDVMWLASVLFQWT
ncbi:uncharacterized protein HaLaN_27860 [Haematococcus lacustris]|uniref:Uncharacterized protein n=1 Tax=Haematococcus lacustris TaxID=44745 RepID=A0A6A0ABF3_HAELA|nr:uncharacterized protein HaLaN_27860 [Haematococcus lacustris]